MRFLRPFLKSPIPQLGAAAVLSVAVAACATFPSVQPQVNSFVIAERYTRALKVLEEHKEDGYGRNNQLLYLLDKGLVEHLAGKYEQSSRTFAAAKRKYDELYTVSLSNAASTWVVNDYLSPYRGEDFERVMVNIFQALNYAVRGDINEALVEARDVDSLLNLINRQYASDQRNVYKEDAFARFLMGVLYEASGSFQGVNDALISYRKAIETYAADYRTNYGTLTPRVLIENYLSAAQRVDPEEFARAKAQFPDVDFLSLEQKRGKAQVYVVHYNGLAPQKFQDSLVFPLPGGYLSKIAFPRYEKRLYDRETSQASARALNGLEYFSATELGEDIAAIAVKNLENRRFRVLVKAVGRPAAKYLVETAVERKIRDKYGDTPSDLFRYGSSFYNVYSEQTDLRAWMTLPAQIRVARIFVPPGAYAVLLDGKAIGEADLKAGDVRFFLVRTAR